MCGRFTSTWSVTELLENFNIGVEYLGPQLPPDWNVAPTKDIYIVRDLGDVRGTQAPTRELATVSWGLIAPWSKTYDEAVKSQSRAINARSESVHEKPTFRNAFKRSRCLIPATGYFEWATELGKYEPKQPFYIYSQTKKPLAFAGIYDRWHDQNGKIFESAALITRPAVGELATIHSRMPTFLPMDRWDQWLSPQVQSDNELISMLDFPEPDKGLSLHPVSPLINSNRNSGEGLIKPIEISENSTLF